MNRKMSGIIGKAFLGVAFLLPVAAQAIKLGDLTKKFDVNKQAKIVNDRITAFQNALIASKKKIDHDRAVCIGNLFNPPAGAAYKDGNMDLVLEIEVLSKKYPDLDLDKTIWQFIRSACSDGSTVPVQPSVFRHH
jgi:hypothetical protein